MALITFGREQRHEAGNSLPSAVLIAEGLDWASAHGLRERIHGNTDLLLEIGVVLSTAGDTDTLTREVHAKLGLPYKEPPQREPQHITARHEGDPEPVYIDQPTTYGVSGWFTRP